MDPKLDEDTFAGRLRDLDKLRREDRTDGDWREWKRVVIGSVEAGKALEEAVVELQKEVATLAKQGAVAALRTRLEPLEREHKSGQKLRALILKAIGAVALVVITHVIDRLDK